MKYSVIWAQSAAEDLIEIIEYISMESGDSAKRIYERIKSKAETLETLPLKGRVVPEFKKFNIEIYRELIESPWRIIYRIENDTVVVLALFDGRRDVEELIFSKIFKK